MSVFVDITLVIAVWGAGLSTYKVLSDYRTSKRTLKVEVTNGFISQGNEVSPPILNISAINIGFRDVTLNSVGFLLPDGRKTIMMEQNTAVRFPYTLTEGNQCTVWKFRSKMAEELKKNGFLGKVELRGYYQSATGDYFKSKPFKFDIDSKLNKDNYDNPS